MKILISDFDGTLFVNDKEIIKNAKMIKDFREKGNIFIISTARNYQSIKNACIRYNIQVDYFFCDIGSVILDNEGNVLYKQYINQDDRKNIESILLDYEKIVTIKRYGTNGKQGQEVKDVVEYKIESDYEILDKIKKKVDKVIKNAKTQITEDNRFIIHTNTKEDIIDIFIDKNKIDVNSIITIGDELDDLGMLKKYNGYRMKKCNQILIDNNINSVASVHELIKLICE
jgi:hydroxymethylpyrimidine pyrophosphatase-like HAD family hydrolase